MPRYLPETEHVCHVCGTRFLIRTGFDPAAHGNKLRSSPQTCPCCTAPVKSPPAQRDNAALTLVLTHYGARYYRKTFGSVEKLLTDLSLRPEDVDGYLRQVEQLDYDEWEANLRRSLTRPGEANDPEVREELADIDRARKDAASGALLTALRGVAGQVRARLSEERERYLQIYQQNCGDKAKAQDGRK